MSRQPFALTTQRLLLRSWTEADREPFARMNADLEVMHDLGGPLNEDESDRKVERFAGVFDEHGFTRWVIELVDPEPAFIGYCGIVPSDADHPLGPHHDIGWRLVRAAWGHGYASEAAAAALADGFDRLGLTEVLAYTATENIRSQAVMARLGLQRRSDLDFAKHYDEIGLWNGLVWATGPERL